MSNVNAVPLLLGLDSSTTACKALVFTPAGQVVAAGKAAHPLLKPRPGWHEQPAESWWQAACAALRQAVAGIAPARLAGMAISVQRETFVITDEAGEPRMNGLVWMDERAAEMLGEIDRAYGGERSHAESGKPLSANLTAAKLFWIRAHHPELVEGARVMDVHAFLVSRLCGQAVTSWGCADPTGLFDMRRGAWNEALIRAAGFNPALFPPAVPVGAPLGRITPQAAEQTGLPAGLPVIAGVGDGQAAGLGVNAVSTGDVYLNLGTAVVSGTISESYRTGKAFRTSYAAIHGSYVLETVLLGGTYTIAWFLENFAPPGAREAEMEQQAAQVPPGCAGLVLLPYWNTAMNPYWDPSASGAVIGWKGIHGAAHFYRAILEGIAFEQRLHTLGVEAALGQAVERYIAVGGGSRSPLWLQILADITGKPLARAAVDEASALGAAILAGQGVGVFPTAQAGAAAMTRIEPEMVWPDAERGAWYRQLYEEVYVGLYPALKTALGRLARFV